jgi:hypothetical protein
MVKENSIRNSQANMATREKGVDMKVAKEAVGSLLSFFSIMYVIILAASMSYNIGYFKYINPQMVDLMTLNDYIDDTVHNIWFFYLVHCCFLAAH